MKSPFVLAMVYNYIYICTYIERVYYFPNGYDTYIYIHIIIKEAMPCPRLLPTTSFKPPGAFSAFCGGSGAHIGPNCRRRASTSCGIDDVNYKIFNHQNIGDIWGKYETWRFLMQKNRHLITVKWWFNWI